jgi:asparagine synthase (glutamine-hydrolysing)
MPAIVGLLTAGPAASAERQLDRMMTASGIGKCSKYIEPRLGVFMGWGTEPDCAGRSRTKLHESKDLDLVLTDDGGVASEAIETMWNRGDWTTAGCGTDSRDWNVRVSDALGAMQGRFHGIAVNRQQGEVVLFNDRWGLSRLYIYDSAEAVYFA